MERTLLLLLWLTLAATDSGAQEVATPIIPQPTGQAFEPGRDVSIVLHSGRVLRGRVAPRTNPRFLWLTATTEGMNVGSVVAVSEIVQIIPDEPVTLPWSIRPLPLVSVPNSPVPIPIMPIPVVPGPLLPGPPLPGLFGFPGQFPY